MNDTSLGPVDMGPAYAIERVLRLPVILLGLLASHRVSVSVSRDRSDAMQWRFQFGHRAILHITDGVGWRWHTVTRSTRLEIEPLICEAEAIAAAAPVWVDRLGGVGAVPDWGGVARATAWSDGPSIKSGEPRHRLGMQPVGDG